MSLTDTPMPLPEDLMRRLFKHGFEVAFSFDMFAIIGVVSFFPTSWAPAVSVSKFLAANKLSVS